MKPGIRKVCTLGLALATAALPALAGEPPAAPAEPAAETATAPAAEAQAQRAVIDPGTGKLVPAPSEAEARQLEPSAVELDLLSTSSAGLTEQHLPDGTVLVHLGGRFGNALFATVGADGKATIGHEIPADLAAAGTPAATPEATP